jgi:hypothetical protein
LPSDKRARPLSQVSVDLLRVAANEVSELLHERLPLQFDRDEYWGPVAHGFLARAGTLLDSLVLLAEHDRPGESQILLRVLYEHVTTFCWLAIDPDNHLKRWREWTDSRRLKLHMEARQYGTSVLSQTEVAEARSAKPPPSLPQLAREVDDHWSEHSSAFRPFDPSDPHILTFSGFYTAIYRKASDLVHADMFSVDRFATMPLYRQATVHPREKRSENFDFPAFGIPLTGFLLIAFSEHFSWPDRSLIDQINNKVVYYE